MKNPMPRVYILAETQSGRPLVFERTVPHDCVISHSGSGYWEPQGSYDPQKAQGYELRIVDGGVAEPKVGYTFWDNAGTFWKDLDDAKRFYEVYVRDPIVLVLTEEDVR
jgi:hypothetical protein